MEDQGLSSVLIAWTMLPVVKELQVCKIKCVVQYYKGNLIGIELIFGTVFDGQKGMIV